jgi:histidyl-tRNA synthetase|tara:strand:+ start:601 stop:1866 length:1266 start_codon:yes stop_codon:yes gene_type:complete
MQFQAPRGTSDILPENQKYWETVTEKAFLTAKKFGYSKIDTPIFENTELFMKGIGTSTDILEKETYTFPDRGNDSLTLRPEGTAPVCRAYLEHGMNNLPLPVKLFYISSNFRYERPQSGRYRQFHQFGVEAIGEPDPYIDAEVIELAWNFLKELNLSDLILSINSIGDPQCRPKYIENLKTYYQSCEQQLCKDCKRRLISNPLRLLDCKIDSCQPLIENSPKTIDHLCESCSQHWESLKTLLKKINIDFKVENKLVRGLDYYTKTVFEIAPPNEMRTNVITGGGRYDGLIEQLGGPQTPGIGFAIGLERVIENMKSSNISPNKSFPPLILVAHIGDKAKEESVKLASSIRSAGFSAILGPSRGLKSQLRYASSVKASYSVIIGEDELVEGKFILRNMLEGEQQKCTLQEIIEILSSHQHKY